MSIEQSSVTKNSYGLRSSDLNSAMKLNANDFALKALEFNNKKHDLLKEQIILQILGLSSFEGKNHFNTADFKNFNKEMYDFIKICDRPMMIKYLEEKFFKVSHWKDVNDYPTISW